LLSIGSKVFHAIVHRQTSSNFAKCWQNVYFGLAEKSGLAFELELVGDGKTAPDGFSCQVTRVP